MTIQTIVENYNQFVEKEIGYLLVEDDEKMKSFLQSQLSTLLDEIEKEIKERGCLRMSGSYCQPGSFEQQLQFNVYQDVLSILNKHRI